MLSAWSKLRAALGAFGRAREGNVAVTFAIVALPLMGFVGAAVDYSHANSVKVALQSALDSTALMLSKDAATTSAADLNTKALAYFKSLFTKPEGRNIQIAATFNTTGGSALQVSGQVDVPTMFMGIAGFDSITVSGAATSKWGSTRLRVALVLDTTGSMSDAGKMTALKAATQSLLAQLKAAASVAGDVYVSIIPFSKDVNVGSGNYNASWIDWTDWDAVNGTCSKSGFYFNKDLCTSKNGVWTPKSHSTWNGCVTDRGLSSGPSPSNYDRKADPPGFSADSKFPAEQYYGCTSEMVGLNYNWTAMNLLVTSLSPSGSTNQGIGLVWGWQSLVGGGPLAVPAKDPGYKYQEIIILLSDGMNTQNRWYYSQSAVDKRMYDSANGGAGTCANIVASKVTIYTIQVNTGGDPTSTILQNCASDPTKFFVATSASQISTIFSAIGTNLTKLRVAK